MALELAKDQTSFRITDFCRTVMRARDDTPSVKREDDGHSFACTIVKRLSDHPTASTNIPDDDALVVRARRKACTVR